MSERDRIISSTSLGDEREGYNEDMTPRMVPAFLVTRISYATFGKAYYLDVRPEKHLPGGIIIYTMTEGSSRLLEKSPRFSAKRLREIVPPAGLIEELQAEVLARRSAQTART